jgi:calcineurin-like phosphoesterase family protein
MDNIRPTLGTSQHGPIPGFESVEQHDELIIGNWNRLVHKHDTVWILGDITMKKQANYAKLALLTRFM